MSLTTANINRAALPPSLVLHTARHLKWSALDPLEGLLMVLCGVCLGGVCLSVFLDVVTRQIGHPWLWLQEVTSISFTYGIFIGTAAATRRQDHLCLSAMTEAMRGPTRTFFELFNRAVVLAVGLAMVVYGIENARTGLGNLRMPSMYSLAWWYGAIPLSGALVMLFCIEQMWCGLRHGFEAPAAAADIARAG